MVVIKSVVAKFILDSRKDKTIFITIETNVGKFSSSAPNGKSRGKKEAKPYKKSLEEDIKTIKKFSDYFSQEIIEEFDDLRRVEDILDGHVGANTIIALEYAVLKALAKKENKQIWELINPKYKIKNLEIPKLVGNCIGGGKHTSIDSTEEKLRKPDFQEFLLIPETNSAIQSSEINSKSKINSKAILEQIDKNFKAKKNDENAWITNLDEKKVLEILKDLRDNIWDEKKVYLNFGIDVAAAGFYKRKKYHYQNPKLDRTPEEQLGYLSNLIKNFNLFYIEDPFDEEDFESFSKLLKKFPKSLIVGDDLTVTNSSRLKKAIEMKSINSIIVKPNQCGSLMEVKKVCEIAKKNNIKIIFSHRSGETKEDILSDLAFGFQADFLKCGITGKERETKIKRLIEIEKSLI